MKILHCPEIVGGHAQQLARAERALGLDSQSIAFRQNYFRYKADEVLLPEGAGRWKLEMARWRLLWRALSFDVIHYNFGQSIMPSAIHFRDKKLAPYPLLVRLFFHAYSHALELFDVRLLKWLGKTIVVTYQGDDARQGDYCRKHFQITFANEVGEDYYSAVSDEMKRKRIAKFARLADKIYSLNPDLLHVLPRATRFCPYAHIDLYEWLEIKKGTDEMATPVVLHAPSHQGVKGTRFILEAVAKLKSKGIAFDFMLIEGMSNSEAKKHYERADLLIDQLLAGWYGGLAVELMALGKPVICYLRDEDLCLIPNEMRADLPVINATPTTLEEILEYWLTEGRGELQKKGSISRRYVEKWHDPSKIAAELKHEYEALRGEP